MSNDLLAPDLHVEAALGEQITGSVHSWNLTRSPADGEYELVVRLAGCPLECRSCPAPDARGDSGGHCLSLTAALGRIRRCRETLTGCGGGLTLTGGDPFAQPRFTAEVLRRCFAAGLRTTVETTGYLGAIVGDDTLHHVDRMVLDLKSTDPDLYREITGADVHPVLRFARRLGDLRRDTRIRFLLIPGLTDSAENVTGIARFVAGLGNRPRVEIVGFRPLGAERYRRLGLRHPLGHVPSATDDDIARAQGLFARHDCSTVVPQRIPSLS
ncbi:radical SAM protein [Kineosporia sp. J2-2]|uniref:Radical SAM protein n=1 Tax=Kineosporia corallincola TaxID=2835133 RepID=A0ABS5TRI2_9ACTN|nr:radical SAM protein [Kineosporia corallincola]MBT0773401.1 radical SAM protein [Kineosporia corallincola]